MFFCRRAFVCLILGFCSVMGWADHGGLWSSGRADSHAPIGVMGDHTHQKGEWMLSYRWMRMEMDGNRDGTDGLSTEDVLAQFPVTPLNMTMDMHMLGLMYAPSNRLTLMVMAPFLDLSMNHQTRSGVRFQTQSSGIGDVSLSGLWLLRESDRHHFHLNLGMSLPTGSIDERDDIPVMDDAILPYPMQLGSGTYDLKPGLTYVHQTAKASFGGQFMARLPLGDNDRDYTVGDQFMLSVWGARNLSELVSLSARIEGQQKDRYDGADPALNPRMVPTADPALREGSRVDLGLGLNFHFHGGHRLAIEGLVPLHQDLEGPQLEVDWQVTVGWQKSW